MVLLCHDTYCTGHEVPAGIDPEADCSYCGCPLADETGTLLIAGGPGDPADVDVWELCELLGHRWEGVLDGEFLVGACVQCGMPISIG